MPNFLTGIGFTPHGFCLLWNPGLIWLQGTADAITGIAYFSIPVALLVLVRQRGDVAFSWMVGLFAAFILACGATHFLAVFVPAYWFEGAVKALTGLLSVVTAILLWPLIPKALALPSPARMQESIDRLRQTELRLTGALDEVARSEARYRGLAENMSDLVTCIGPDLRRSYVSPSSLRLLGYQPAELIALPPEQLVHPDDWPRVQISLAGMRRGEDTDAIQYRVQRKDGVYIWIEAYGRLMSDSATIMLSIRDVSRRREAQDRLVAANAQLEEMAWVDGLTGLANRRRFDEALAAECDRCRAACMPLSLILIDADRFKLFNDLYGHPAGDGCLQEIAGAAKRMCRRPRDLAARYGGEEFALVLPDMGQEDAVRLAERLRLAVRRLRIEHKGNAGGMVTASIGVATLCSGETGTNAADLLQRADRCLYEAKALGRNAVATEASVAALD
jgi:diguanylate cyclase (GGDEF)-like protein/PAS domain S-box-containing protein